MNSNTIAIGVLVIGGVGAATWWYLNRVPPSTDTSEDDGYEGAPESILDEVTVTAQKLVGSTWPYPRGQEYQRFFEAAEDMNNIPRGLLARQGYQESRFREDIISGQTVAGPGAIGIMQIIPKYHPDVNPYDPVESINYAARFLTSLHTQFGTWELALAAYNWGPGNIKKHPDPATWPTETKNYVVQITADVPVPGVLNA